MKRLSLFILSLCLVIAGCGSEPRARQAKFFAFGTEIDISLYGVDDKTADATVELLENVFSESNHLWHAWQPSTLTNINQAISNDESIVVSDNVAQVIQLAKTIAIDSNHLFNPAAGQLFSLWGFHQDNWFQSRPPPDETALNKWLQSAPTMENITISNGALNSSNHYVKLGFGGFAKGYAIDKAIEALKQKDIHNALINIGGDLRAIGAHGTRPWVIGIRHPRQDGMIASIALNDDESAFTSGDYERFFEFNGVRYPHIIDPRTGYPADQAISVTVLHQNASIADAAATALFVAGNDWPNIAASLDISHVMLVKPNGQIELSPSMAERITLLTDKEKTLIRTIETENLH